MVPPTPGKSDEERLQELRQEFADIEREWNKNNTTLLSLNYDQLYPLGITARFLMIFRLLRELTGKNEVEMDIMLHEEMINLANDARATMEEASKQARLAQILQPLGHDDGPPRLQ